VIRDASEENKIIYNCRIFVGHELLAPGWVEIGLGRILDFGEGIAGGNVDGGGAYLLPGLIDHHCCAFQNVFYPRIGSHIPPAVALSCHKALCLKSGITTVLNTVRVSDIPVWNEADASVPAEREAVCEKSAESEDGPHQFAHFRCDLAWAGIESRTVELVSQYHPRAISFMRCCPGMGRHRNEEFFRNYLRQKARDISLGESDSFSKARNPGDRVMWERAKGIVSSVNPVDVAFCLHDPTWISDMMEASKYGILVAEFPLSDECVDEARSRGIAVCMGAPNALRGASQYGDLSTREVWKAGNLDILTSDYFPPSLLPAIFLLARDEKGELSLPALAKALRTATQAPAQILSLQTKGSIKIGNDADLILVRADDNSEPEVEMTIVGGRIKYCKNPEDLLYLRQL